MSWWCRSSIGVGGTDPGSSGALRGRWQGLPRHPTARLQDGTLLPTEYEGLRCLHPGEVELYRCQGTAHVSRAWDCQGWPQGWRGAAPTRWGGGDGWGDAAPTPGWAWVNWQPVAGPLDLLVPKWAYFTGSFVDLCHLSFYPLKNSQ